MVSKVIFIPQLLHFVLSLCSFWSFNSAKLNTEMTLNRSFEILVNFILAPALMIFTVLLYAYVVQNYLSRGYYQKAWCRILRCLT